MVIFFFHFFCEKVKEVLWEYCWHFSFCYAKILFLKKGGKGFRSAKTNRHTAVLAFALNIMAQIKTYGFWSLNAGPRSISAENPTGFRHVCASRQGLEGPAATRRNLVCFADQENTGLRPVFYTALGCIMQAKLCLTQALGLCFGTTTVSDTKVSDTVLRIVFLFKTL